MLKYNQQGKVNQYKGQFVLRFLQLVIIFGAVKKILFYTVLLFFIIPQSLRAQFEASRDSVVQLYGIIMTADSLVGIPAVSVMVKGQNRGTISNAQGVFSIVVLKGDEVEFTHVTYKSKTISIPRNIEGNQYSIVQLMVIDTVYLPATILRPRPTPDQFARDFANAKVPDDNIEIARQNTSVAKRRILLRTVSGDGGEATRIQMNKVANRAVYQGQTPPMNIMNPAAWVDFIQAWKRGDFKNKN
jgi:CarboxypepD_reg-like domain